MSDNPIFDCALSSSPSASLRLLSAEFFVCDLLSHFRNLPNVWAVFDESGFPVESWFRVPITVLSPLSCIFSDSPGPVLVLSDLSEKILRSAPLSSVFSDMIQPQPEQAISPVTSSVMNWDTLQLLHASFTSSIFCRIVKFSLCHDSCFFDHAIRMNFFICVDIAFVANKLDWFFAYVAILEYFHTISTFSARVNFHQLYYVVVCIKGV